MDVSSILISATDVARCAECPLRMYYARVVSLPYLYYDQNTIWSSLEHNVRAILTNTIRQVLTSKKAFNRYDPKPLIEDAIRKVYDENPFLLPYHPDEVKEIIGDLRNRLTIEEESRIVKIRYYLKTHDLDDALDLARLPRQPELMLRNEDVGLIGRVDGILHIDQKFIPYDIKCHLDMDVRRYDLQLCVYSLLIESQYDTDVDIGIIYDSKNMQDIIIPITNELREEVFTTRALLLNILQGFRPKGNPARERCQTCPYHRDCEEKWSEDVKQTKEPMAGTDVFNKIMSADGPLNLFNDEEVA